MLKKVIVTFLNALRRKRGFRLATFFNDLRPLKNGGTSLCHNRLSKNQVFHQPVSRMLKKVIVTFFTALCGKRGFPLATFFNGLPPSKNGGTSMYRNRLVKISVFHQPVREPLIMAIQGFASEPMSALVKFPG